jgi:hypothetical protein
MPKIIYDEIMRQTDKAIQYKIDTVKPWIPISQIISEDLGNHVVELPQWLIEADGLEAYIID